MPSVCASVCPFVTFLLPHSFITISSSNLQGMFMAISVRNFGLFLKNKVAAVGKCLKIRKRL